MQKIKKKVKKTGELLCDAGLLTEEQLLQALQRQKETNKKFGDVVIDMGFVSDLDIAKVLSETKSVFLMTNSLSLLKSGLISADIVSLIFLFF